MIIIVNGSLGVGKSSVAEQLHWKFERSVSLDGDYIGDVNPFEIYDEARTSHLYDTLALLIGFHQKAGYHNFVINYVFENAVSLQSLLDRLTPLDSDIRTFWLTCAREEQARRIRGRGRDQVEWELKRFAELQEIQRSASLAGFIGEEVDTTNLTLKGVGEYIWRELLG